MITDVGFGPLNALKPVPFDYHLITNQCHPCTLPCHILGSRTSSYIVDTLLHCASGLTSDGPRPKPCPALPRQKGEMHVVSWILELDSRISCLLNSLKIVLDSYVSCHCSSNIMSIFFQVPAEKMEEMLDFDKYAN